jgi:quinolinate synthetase A subunit
VRALKDKGHKILWAPDRHLGGYIQRETGADMVMWNGSCIVHDEFKAFELEALMNEHPHAKVLVHPESPDVVALADAVGSTSAILKAAREMDAKEFIVATDNGMMHKLRTLNPGKLFLRSPHRRQQRHLQKLRPLPLDGHERPGRVWPTCWRPEPTKSTWTPPWASAPACRLTVCWRLPRRSS